MLRVKSVKSPIDPEEDGFRILATRFRGRGLPADRYDAWVASLGPSEALLERYLDGKITWSAFGREYVRELRSAGPVDEKSRTIKNHGQKFTLRLIKALAEKQNVTLMCHCEEDAKHCHRFLLQREVLRS
jgi:uncharacterized protein YeaO (DUF488 family)